MKRTAHFASTAVIFLAACSAAPATSPVVSVAAAAPPKDDGKPSEGGSGGGVHSSALEQLKTTSLEARDDKQGSIRIPLPDAAHWTRVKFWGVQSLVGFRYGKDHHALVAAFVTHVEDNSAPGACSKSFESWATPWIDAFDVVLDHEPPVAVMWNRHVVEVDSLFAKTATIASREGYAAAYAAYPVWQGACLVVGVAVPARDDEARAREVRDRFVKDVLRGVEVMAKEEPKERY